MRRLALSVVFLVPVLSAAPCFGGDWFDSLWASMKLDFHRNNKWPDTFNYVEREAEAAPFEMMVHNGWRMQNTIGPYHFEDGSTNLTEAGRLKIHWILTQAPDQFRTIYVEQAESRQATVERINSVRAVAARLAPAGERPQVLETAIPARDWSGESVNSYFKKFGDSQPAPVLPKASGDSGGGSGS